MVFHWSLSDIKSPRISRTLLSILADLNNALVWMFSIRPLYFQVLQFLYQSLVTVPSAPITIGITVTFTFHGFFQFLNQIEIYIFLFTFLHFYSVVSRDSKVHNSASFLFFFFFFFFFWLFINRSGRLAEIR